MIIMKVLKFGGSSVGTPERIRIIGELIGKRSAAGENLSIVFSAFGGVTDDLIKSAELAARGKEKYRDVFEALRQRHLTAIQKLLKETTECAAQVEEHFEVLKNLLKGVFLVREASSRTMDYILSFGERNAAFIIASYFREIGHFISAVKVYIL